MPHLTARRALTALTLAATALVVTLSAPTTARPPAKTVTVMTRNLFLGANLIPLATAQPGHDFEQATGKLLDEIKSTEPAARMKLVAGEIAKEKPDLVGLQEVTLWRTGPKNDPAPAKHVVIDYLATIKKELKRRGGPVQGRRRPAHAQPRGTHGPRLRPAVHRRKRRAGADRSEGNRLEVERVQEPARDP